MPSAHFRPISPAPIMTTCFWGPQAALDSPGIGQAHERMNRSDRIKTIEWRHKSLRTRCHAQRVISDGPAVIQLDFFECRINFHRCSSWQKAAPVGLVECVITIFHFIPSRFPAQPVRNQRPRIGMFGFTGDDGDRPFLVDAADAFNSSDSAVEFPITK